MNNRVRYTRQNIISNNFYQLPKFLFDEEFSGLSNDARVLYALLRNRHEISIVNGWFDEKDEAYQYFKREDMQAMLRVSENTITKAMRTLKEYGLLEEQRQGAMKPNRIYLLAVGGALHGIGESAENAANTMNLKNYGSCSSDFAGHEPQNLRLHGNHNKINQNKDNHNHAHTSAQSCPVSQNYSGRQDTDKTEPRKHPFSMLSKEEEHALTERKINGYTLLVKENINYNDLAQSRPYEMPLVDEFIAVIIDTIFTEGSTVRIGGENKPRELVKSQLLKLTYDDIEHAIDQFKGVTERITKKKQYILTMLYNCKMEIDSHYTNAYNADRWQ